MYGFNAGNFNTYVSKVVYSQHFFFWLTGAVAAEAPTCPGPAVGSSSGQLASPVGAGVQPMEGHSAPALTPALVLLPASSVITWILLNMLVCLSFIMAYLI